MRKLLKQAAFVVAVLATCAGIESCYDTTKPTPPCSVNAHQPGCPDWPSDAKRAGGPSKPAPTR